MAHKLFRVPTATLKRINLWPRLVVAVSLGFLALFIILDLLLLPVVDDSRDRILQERLVIAQLAARQVDGVLQHAFSGLEAAATSLHQDSLAADRAQVPDQLARILRDTGDMWLGLYLLDASGNPLAAAPASRLEAGVDPAVAAGIGEAIAAGGRGVSAPYRDALSGRPAAVLTVPAGSESFLAGVIDLSRPELVGALTNAKGLGETGHAELFDSRGLVIASTDPVAFLAPGEHEHLYLRVLGDGRERVETAPLEARDPEEAQREGSEHIMAVGRVSSAPWGVAVGGSKAETLAPVTDLRNKMLLLGAASLVVLWLATLIGARLLVRPVRVLTRAADRVAAGDLDTPIGVAEGGEIGRLGETLEAMRARLRSSLREIEQRDRDLERRVDERTREVQRLLDELQRKEEMRGRLLENVISAQEEERKRIARELHDETGQALTGIILSLEAARDALDRKPAAARKRLETAESLASQSIEAIRHLVVDLRPAALDDLGLVPALRAFAEGRLGEKGIRLKMETSGLKDRLSPPVETCLFRVVQEAVTNVVRHSEAKSAHIELTRDNGVVTLLVTDDGQGFDLPRVMSSPDRTRALGLAGMEERVSLIGGHLTVESTPGRGTRVQATIRLESDRQQP